ncbi:hypothetical protein, partial [Blautia sp.]|uniref:hypothetical protein n=1 Tax=Blautia sp. TaxID=1955243 RepID=UPI003AB23230
TSTHIGTTYNNQHRRIHHLTSKATHSTAQNSGVAGRGGARGGEHGLRNYECFPSSQLPHAKCSRRKEIYLPHAKCSRRKEIYLPHAKYSRRKEIYLPHAKCSRRKEIYLPHAKYSRWKGNPPYVEMLHPGRESATCEMLHPGKGFTSRKFHAKIKK